MVSNAKKFTVGLLIFVMATAALLPIGAQEVSVLRVGMPEPVNLDPATGSNDPEVLLNRHIYDYLVEVLPSGDLAPSLAASWDVSDDGLVYTFNLVEGVSFHDGSSFAADDVVFTFNRLVEVGSSAVGLLGQRVAGTDDEGNSIFEPTFTVEASDDYTVVFTLESPNPDFLYGVASRFAVILPDGLQSPNDITDGGLESFNGTGPFRLQAYNAGQSAVLVANEGYWNGRPASDQLELIFIDDTNAQVNALRTGEVDFIFKVPTDLLPNLESDAAVTVTTQSTNTHPVIRIRSDSGAMGEDVRIRQAFRHATDRELLNLDVLDGLGAVGNNDPIGPTYGSLYAPQEYLAYDPQIACDLLAAYAADNPDNQWVTVDGGVPRLEVDFYVADALGYAVLAEFMEQQWQDGCIFVNLIIRPENIYYGNNEWMEVDLGLTGWGTRPTPQEYLNVAYVTGAPFNESHWSNAELDALSQQAATISDPAARAEIYHEIARIFEQEGPIIVPYFLPVHGAYRNGVEGLEMHPFPGSTNLSMVTTGN